VAQRSQFAEAPQFENPSRKIRKNVSQIFPPIFNAAYQFLSPVKGSITGNYIFRFFRILKHFNLKKF
jgi:hypothetical protein